MWAGESPSKSSDIYSVGCVWYEICMGGSRPATSLLLPEKKPILIEELGLRYGRDVCIVISSAIHTRPEKRPTFEKFLQVLDNKQFQSLIQE